MRVLVVEDNLLNQQVAEELLSREGALVSMAGNGRLGVEAVAAAKPQFDAVLMDLQMPVLDGYAATQEIRHTLGLAHLPVIAMTANALESDRLACIAAGMSEHIGKPFDMDKLVALLLRVTGLRPPGEADDARHLTLVAESPLPQVDGLDLATALNRMSGMRTLYVRSASELVRTLGTVVGDLQRHLAAGEPLAARMLLHTLKGNAATLGAGALATVAAELEAGFSTGATVHGDRYEPKLAAEIEWALARGWDRSRYASAPPWPPRRLGGGGPKGPTARTRDNSRSLWWRDLDELVRYF